jgi:hypothetical protein
VAPAHFSLFVNFTVAQGTARVACVADSKKAYDPKTDFYKGFRERAVRQLVDGWSAQAFRKSLQEVKAPGKQASYEACRVGLTHWARNKAITASRAPNKIWEAAGLEVKVNPELRLTVDENKYVVKLYFKAPELTSARRENMLFLLSETAPQGVEAGILDVRRGELITAQEQDPNLDALISRMPLRSQLCFSLGSPSPNPDLRPRGCDKAVRSHHGGIPLVESRRRTGPVSRSFLPAR